jgi:glycosyltransferase involved in cell wall biosynthesis
MTLQRLGNGQRVDHLVESLWRQAFGSGVVPEEPDDPAVAEVFVGWVREVAPGTGARRTNRYLHAAYLTRPDLQARFGDLGGTGDTGLVRWAWERGRRELIGELLPPHPEPGSGFRARLGVEMIGFLGEALGLGEAARLYVEGLRAAGIAVSTRGVRPDATGSSVVRAGSQRYRDAPAPVEPGFNIVCINPDSLAAQVHAEGAGFLAGRPTIGQWAWETDVLPPSWAGAFGLVDEVWVNSTFVAENLGRLLPVPVVVLPQPIIVPERAGTTPAAGDGRFTFLFMLDLLSSVRRKNPLGVVDAFTRAFAPNEGPRLLIKTMNADLRPEAAGQLRVAAGDRQDVEFFDGYLDPAAKAGLIADADCYVSLHRSEGFGLTLAEAMALGTPVIVTGYSGNMDFTTPGNSYLVDWRPIEVGPDCEVYPAHGHWAEPDLEHAARQLRRVWQRPDEAAARARRAQADITRAYDPRTVGTLARARLELLSDFGKATPRPPARRGGVLRAAARRLNDRRS